MSNSVRAGTLPKEHPIAWAFGKLLVAAMVTIGIIGIFTAASYLLGTKPPQQPVHTMPR